MKMRNKKGIALYMTAFIVMIAVSVVSLGAAAFQTYANFTAKYVEDLRVRYVCECGIERGLWLVMNGYGPAAGNTLSEAIPAGTTDTVEVNISLDAGIYTITATSGGRTITAEYNPLRITQWR